MIQERERPVRRECCEPQRQPAELHGHRVDVHAEQAPLRDRPAETGALVVGDVACHHRSRQHQRPLVRGREIPAGGHEKSAAAHRGIEDPQRQDGFGLGVAHQGRERAPNDILRQCAGRVERACCLAALRVLEPDRAVDLDRFEIEHTLVDASQLLDPEIGIRDSLPPRSRRSSSSGPAAPAGRRRRRARPIRPAARAPEKTAGR